MGAARRPGKADIKKKKKTQKNKETVSAISGGRETERELFSHVSARIGQED